MAGAYLEFIPQETYSFTSNVLLSNVAQELYGSLVYFSMVADQNDPSSLYTSTPFINLSSANTSNISFSNNNTNTNSLITVNISSQLTANLSYVNSAFWALVAKTSTNSVYTLDRGRGAVIRRMGGVTY